MQSSDKNIMNTFKKSVAFLMLMLSAISCSGFLDQVPDDRLTLDVAFEQRGHVEDFLANIYSRLPHDTQRFVGGRSAERRVVTVGRRGEAADQSEGENGA